LELSSQQQLTTSPKSESKLEKIRNWSSALTAEERDCSWIVSYYVWPKNVIRLRELLKSSHRKLIAVTGVQGVGKTSTMHVLLFPSQAPYIAAILRDGDRHDGKHLELEKVKAKNVTGGNMFVAFNWGEMRNFLEGNGPLPSSITLFSSFGTTYLDEINSSLAFKPVKSRSIPRGRRLSIEVAELHLGKARVRQARWNAVKTFLQNASTILIDMPDYSKTDRRLMVNDLETIQMLWRNLRGEFCEANFVIFLQREMFHDHFLFGKMEVFTLDPFKPSELVEGYKRIHKGTFPFTEESLLLLARMSRGIFRRFVKYIHMTLEGRDNATKITERDVRKSVSEQQLLVDNEEELAQIFPKSDQSRLQALKVMQFLETRTVNQKELAEAVGVSAYALSRILDKLELHHKIRREKRGLENMIQAESN